MKIYGTVNGFRDLVIKNISETINNEGYKYIPSKNKFEKVVDKNIFRINLYFYKRTGFIEIDTKIYYGNKHIESKLKNNKIKAFNDVICGGNIKFISEYYFNRKFQEKYSNLIYETNEPPQPLIQKWLGYYFSIIKPFFTDCLDPLKLNKIVNEERIDTTGLNLNYQNRVLKFYYVGKDAGIADDKLKEMALLYKEQMEIIKANYLNKYMELMKIEKI
jgi:hypothetical protein